MIAEEKDLTNEHNDNHTDSKNPHKVLSPGQPQSTVSGWKKITPVGTVDWYVKWISSFILLIAVAMRASEFSYMADLILSTIGVSGWLFVAFVWKDRALIMLHGTALFILMTGLFTKIKIII